MRISHFFIDRPIFAAVVSIVFVILGGVSFSRLPVAQYPEIAPPIINVSGQYPGASADVVASTVVTPIEEQINGVENMLYMSSNSTADGRFSIQVSFDLGTNLDIAQVQVQNRVAIAQPRLPADVRNIGVTVHKGLARLDDGRAPLFARQVAQLAVHLQLRHARSHRSADPRRRRRLDHRVRQPRLFDADLARSGPPAIARPDRDRCHQRAAGQNIQVASGVLDQPPVAHPGAFQIAVQTLGRLDDPDEFGSIVVKADAGRRGAAQGRRQHRARRARLFVEFLSRPRSRGRARRSSSGRARMRSTPPRASTTLMEQLAKRFPPGVKYAIVYNPTQFIQQSVDAVIDTIGEAIVLVVLVVILFLQTWRAAIIPLVAIPVSLIGTLLLHGGVRLSR